MRTSISQLLTISLCLLFVLPAQAEDQSTEARLRDALKQMVTQLRAAQDQLATAQAAQAESDRQLGLAKGQITQLDSDLKELKQKSQADHEAAVKAINALQEQNAMLQRVVEDRERKNYELYKTGNEVLSRYEKFSLGEAVLAKEPFMGLTRVKLENLVQGYEDKFANNKTYAGEPVAENSESLKGGSSKSGDGEKGEEKGEGLKGENSKGDGSLPVKDQAGAASPAVALAAASSTAQAAPTPAPAPAVVPAGTGGTTKDSGDKDKVMKSPK